MIKKGVDFVRKKPIIFIVVLALMLQIITFSTYGDGGEDATPATTGVFDLKAKAYTLMEADTGNILIEGNSHEKLPIASITKIMSMLLIMEAIDSGKLTFDDRVYVSDHAFSMGGSQVWLEPGEEFSVDEMLKAVAIHSANDATVALAETVAGSEEAFVAMMNQKAKELGMNNTNFLDCTGLTDDGHYSTAHDIAIMSRELITKHPKILEYTSIWQDKFRDGVEGKTPVALDNTNKLIRFYEGANGLKTGFTRKAGHCLSATAKRNNLQLIAVVLGEPDSNTRFTEARKLLDYGFANYESRTVNSKGEQIQEIEVKRGLKTSVNAVYSDDVNLLVKKGSSDAVERQINIETSIKAPVKAGQKIGEVVYILDGKEIGKTDIVADADVERATFGRLFVKIIIQWFGMGRR